MTIKIDGIEWTADQTEEAQVTRIEMWYDRHRKHWVIYPVDSEGNQTAEARYGFGKAEAQRIKEELENEYNI